jgi:nucleoside recognition membrane protein YjiH
MKYNPQHCKGGNKMPENEQSHKYQVTWKGWLALALLCLSFSGLFTSSGTILRAIDFTALTGQFGVIAGSKSTFQGAGGTGAREGLLFTITLIPTIMLALGLIQVAESMGALRAAEKVFRPFLRPFLGIPGVAGLAFVSSFTSSDIGAVMTKELVENKMMSDDERVIFVSYQYAGSAVVANTFGTGGPLIPISILPVGAIIALIFVCKVIGAIMVRGYMAYYRRKHPLEGEAV